MKLDSVNVFKFIIFIGAFFSQNAICVEDVSKLNLLLLGNSVNEGMTMLEHALPAIDKWRGSIDTFVVIPFAQVDENKSIAAQRLALDKLHIKVEVLPKDESAQKVLDHAKVVYITGGSTFKLLKTLQDLHLLEPLRRKILSGMPYMGSSAGTNIIAPTIMTTNDMPIVAPKDLNALNVLPFQINPHFTDTGVCIPGETREDRLLEFTQLNAAPILALRQGAWISVKGNKISLDGAGARVFRHGDRHFDPAKPNENKPREFPAGTHFGFDLNTL